MVRRRASFSSALLISLLVATGGTLSGRSTASSVTVLGVIPMTLSTQAVAVDSVRNRIFVVQDDVFGEPGFELVVVDGPSHAVLATFSLDGTVDPYGIAVDETARRVYVHNTFGVAVFDADTLLLHPHIGYQTSHAGGVAVDPATHRVFAGANVALYILDGPSGAVLDSFFLGAALRDLEFDPVHNRVYATHSRAGFFSVVDLTARSVTQVPISGTILAMAVDSVLGQAYFAQRTLSPPANVLVYDTATLSPLTTIPIAPRTEGLAIDPSSHLVYAPSGDFPYGVTIIDGASRSVAAVVPTPRQVPRGVAVNSLTHRSYYPDSHFPPESTIIVIGSPNDVPAANAGADQTIECAGHGGTRVILDASASTDPDGDTLSFEWKNAGGAVIGSSAQTPIDLPLGTHTFTLTVTDDDGATASDAVTITVQDTTPPAISSASASPAVLWPPHGRMMPVAVTVGLADACDANASCRIVAVASSEPPTVRGAGNRAPDWEIDGPMTLRLRAERSGGGSGRTYAITIECRDASSNAAQRDVHVFVPHDRR